MLRVALAAAVVALAVCAPARADHSVALAHRRIVTLVPSFAEDLFAIGAASRVVGVSQFTDVAAARGLPRVADVTGVNTEAIVALHPDLVVGIPSQERLIAPLRRAGITVRLLDDDSYDEIFTDIAALGDMTGRRDAARAEIARLHAATAALQARARVLRRPPSVFVALGTGPIWTAGSSSYIATLIRLAGGRDAASDLKVAWGQYSAEALLRAQPDVIVTGNDTRLGDVLDREPWRSLHAVAAHHVYVISNDDLLYRPGPRYVEGLRWLVERLTASAS